MNYSIGSTIAYQDFCGGTRVVVVTAKAEIKGRNGFEGYIRGHKEFQVWGYNSQITYLYSPLDVELGRVPVTEVFVDETFGL